MNQGVEEENFVLSILYRLWPCLVLENFANFFKIPNHIESLDTCIKY
jgi:hypothetical protein